MANTYYKYRKWYSKTNGVYDEICLQAVGNNNEITLSIERDGGQPVAAILTEQEQNDLIAGILERRGVSPKAYKGWLTMVGYYDAISATGSEQSKIHPAE